MWSVDNSMWGECCDAVASVGETTACDVDAVMLWHVKFRQQCVMQILWCCGMWSLDNSLWSRCCDVVASGGGTTACDTDAVMLWHVELRQQSQWARNGLEFFEEWRQKPLEGMKLGQLLTQNFGMVYYCTNSRKLVWFGMISLLCPKYHLRCIFLTQFLPKNTYFVPE